MIVIDTSALMAILQGEPEAAECLEAVELHNEILIAAPTLCEAMIVAAARGLQAEMTSLIDGLVLSVKPLTEVRCYAAFRGYLEWGKGYHRAALNFGDCFALALAKEHDCPLLFVGNDFAATDVKNALA